jgi:hypothetical protein
MLDLASAEPERHDVLRFGGGESALSVMTWWFSKFCHFGDWIFGRTSLGNQFDGHRQVVSGSN